MSSPAKTEIGARLCALLASPRATSKATAPVMGYFCSYVPIELLLAAGLQPLRLKGFVGQDSATGDAYLSHLTCSFARHVTAAVLDGVYDFLAGQIAVNTCDHVRRANDAIVAKSKLQFHGYISVPRTFRGNLLPWYVEELEELKRRLEEHFGVKITDERLAQAIEVMNEVRERAAQLEALRQMDPPRLSGADVLTVLAAARLLPPEEFLRQADEFITAAQTAPPLMGIRARVVLMGGELDDPGFVEVLESQGAHVAADLLCWGSRGLGRKIESYTSPLHALAESYLYQIPCARMMGEFPRRWEKLKEIYQTVGARGVIFQRIKFCQIWSSEVHNLRHRLKDKNAFPLLVLDREYGVISTGQIKTRVQAFLERLGA